LVKVGWAAFLLLGLSACSVVPNWANPIEWYRDATGASKNDSKGTEANTANLEKGSDEPYPNLASVPAPPTNALSQDDRDKLEESLRADREHAKYIEPGPPSASAPAASGASGEAQSASSSRGEASPPQESPLTSPSIANLPEGETPRPAPPPPGGVATNTASAGAAANNAPASSDGSPPVSIDVGVVEFEGKSTTVSAEALDRLRDVMRLRQENSATIRVTGYSTPGIGRDDASRATAGFDLALDRAKAVAVALTQMGVPVQSVAVAAEPAPSSLDDGSVALALEY
jgi:outer membrane protein OmpA-like peptidoglycan-associated protein